MAIYNQFEKDFLTHIKGVSYVGKPKSFTMMYLTKKIEDKLEYLSNVQGCLVFIENTVNVPPEIVGQHIFVACENPASSYTEIALLLDEKIETEFRAKKYLFIRIELTRTISVCSLSICLMTASTISALILLKSRLWQ